MPACREHRACRVPFDLSVDDVRTAARTGPVGFYVRVLLLDGSPLGTVRDSRGYVRSAGRHVEYRELWSAYAGGQEITRDLPDREAAVRALIRHVVDASFRTRMALHG